MKTLVVCSAGIARSHAMNRHLKTAYDFDSVAAGVHRNGPELLRLLSTWADRIVVMEKGFEKELPEQARGKVVVTDVGLDVWGDPSHEDLVRRVQVMAEAWEKDGFASGRTYSLRPKVSPAR